MEQTTNLVSHHHGPKVLKIIIGILLALLLLSISANQVMGFKNKFKPATTISVSGLGKAIGIPDVGLISLSVISDKASAKEVMQDNAKKMNEIIKFVKDSGVEAKDVQTSGYYLNPRYDWQEGTRIFRGYELTSTLSVKIRNLDKISDIIDGAVSRGANQVGNIQFVIDDQEKLKAEARDKAIIQAKGKAKQIAKSTGLHLGKIISFSESEGSYTYPQPLYLDKGMGGAETAPVVEQGSQEIQITVSLGFELK